MEDRLTFAALKQALSPLADASLAALQVLTEGAARASHEVVDLLASPWTDQVTALEDRLSEKDVELITTRADLANATEEVERRRKALAFDGTLVEGLRERMFKLEQCLTSVDSTLESVTGHVTGHFGPILAERCAKNRRRIAELLPSNSPAPASTPQAPPVPDGEGIGAGDVPPSTNGAPDSAPVPSLSSEEILVGARWVYLPTGRLFIITDMIPATRQVRLAEPGGKAVTSLSIDALATGKKWRYVGPLCIAHECEVQADLNGLTCALHDIGPPSIPREWLRIRLGRPPEFLMEARGG